MSNRILVPLDGSDLAEQSLPCATMLAQGLNAELILFRAVSLPPEVSDVLEKADLPTDGSIVPLEAVANEYLSRVARQLEATDLNVSTAVRPGPAAEAILDYIEHQDIRQIVMATHGYGGISRWVHGSVAERVLQAASVPLLLVRAHEQLSGASYAPMYCRRILIPLDGSAVAEKVLAPAIRIARALDAELVLFQVLTIFSSLSLMGEWYLPVESIVDITREDTQAYLARIASKLEVRGIKVSTDIKIGGVANAILQYAEANQIDLIAMCTHGRTGLARWALGSVADRVLRAGRIPLLLVRAG